MANGARRNKKSKINLFRLAFSIFVCLFVGMIGSVFTGPSIGNWYTWLVKPSFNPPNWIFGPVWTALYILMGLSLYLVWEKGMKKVKVHNAVYIFGVQLALNLMWSIIFFGLRSPFYAFVEIILLWLAIAATIHVFYKIEKKAAGLLMPYICWVTFAAILNFSIWKLNPLL